MLIIDVLPIARNTFKKIVLLLLCNFIFSAAYSFLPLHPGSIGSDQTVCIGGTPNSFTSITPATGVGTITYQWQISTTSASSGFTNIVGATALTYSHGAVSVITYFRRVASNGVEAPIATDPITINISLTSVGGTFIGAGTYCTSAASIQLSLNSFNGTLLSWQSADDSSFTTNVTTISTTNNPLSVGRPFPFVRYYRALVDVPGCGSIFSRFVKIIVVDQTVAGTSAGNTTFCSTTNSHNITLSGNVGSVLRWESSPNSNFIPLTNINNTTTTLSLTNINTTTYYRAVVRNDSCDTKTSTSSIVTILTSPDAGTLMGSDTICNSNNINSTTLVLNNFVGSISKWQSSSNSNFTTNVTDIANTNDSLTITNLSTTTYYRVIVTNGSCPADTSNVAVIMLNPLSNGGNLTGNNPFNPNIIVCSGINSSTLILSSHVGTILKWQSSSSSDFSGTVIDITNTTSSYLATNLTSTTYYRVIVKSGICEADTSNIRVITVNPVTDAGILNNDTVCGTTNSTTIRLSNYIGSIIKWESSTVASFSSGITTIANTTDSLVVINLSTTTYYRVIVKSGVCSADTSNIANIVVNPASVGGTLTGGGHFCPTVAFPVLFLNGHVGSILRWERSSVPDFSSNVTVINFTGTNYSTTILTPSTFYYRAVIKNGVCPIAYSTVDTIIIDSTSVGGTITGSGGVCSTNDSITLILGGYTGSIIKWQSSTSPTFSNSITDIVNTTNTYIATNISTATYYRAVIKSGTCSSVNSSIASILITAPTAGGNITGPIGFCSLTNSSTLTLSIHVGTIIEWQSSTNANFTGTVTSIPNTANLTSYTAVNLTTTTYFRVLLKNGNCASAFSTVKALTSLGPFPDAGIITGPSAVCSGTNNATLTLTSYVGTIVKWQSSTLANFSSSVVDIANTTNTLNIVNLNSVMYYRAIVLSGALDCEDTSDAKAITIDTKPIAGSIIGSDTLCAGINSNTLHLINYTGNIVHWQSSNSQDFSTNLQTIANTSDSLVVNNLLATTFYRVIVSNGVCDPDTSLIAIIKVDSNSTAAEILNNDTLCINQNSKTLKLINFFGSVLYWQSSTDSNFISNLQTINNTTDSLVVNNLNTSTYYRVLIKNGTCSIDTSKFVFLKIDELPIAGLLSNSDSFCLSNITINTLLRLNSYFGSIVKWQSSLSPDFSSSIIDINNITDSLLITNITQTIYYRVIVSNGVCNNDTSNIVQLFIKAPSNAGNLTGNNPFNPNIIVCADSNSSTLILSSYIGSIIKWQSAADSNFTTSLTDINNTTNSLLVINISTTTYYRVIVQNADCEPDTSNFKVIIVNQPSVAGQILSDTICINGNTILKVTNYIGSILFWQSSSSNDFSTNLQTIANTTDSLIINNLSATTYYRVIVKNGVCAIDTSLIAFVKVVSNSYSNTIISPQPDSFIISGNPNTIIGSINSIDSNFISYQWQYAVITDSTLFMIINNSDSINHDPNTITQTTWYRRIIYNSICNSYDTSNVIRLTVLQIDTNINAMLGLALNVANPINLSEGTYQIDYRITIKNYGNTDLEKIRLKENLSNVFFAPSTFIILNVQSSTGLILDPNFDGVNQLFLLDSTQNNIAIGATHNIDIRLQVQTNLSNVIYYNQVTAIANAVNSIVTAIDTSVDGLNPDPNNDSIPDEQSPTIVEILVFVPSGFSPNGDGKNDEFKIRGIENYPNNKLEIYNRWGNLVFEQAPYDNTWRGDVKNSNAYIIGDGILPSGTYFYLLDFGVPGSKQLSGYIVIRK